MNEKKKSAAEEMKALFVSENVTLQEHFDAQSKSYNLYTSVLFLLISQGTYYNIVTSVYSLKRCGDF
jgi:hypothetical protein